jgi:CubicO group peptidase (beta-lactamase class C family)
MPDLVKVASLEEALRQHGVPGVSIAVVESGAPRVHAECAGTLAAGSVRPVDTGSIFEAASLSKPCFALAVMRLVDSGDLSLDAPLASYIGDGDLMGGPESKQITVRNVLSHTSGLPSVANSGEPLHVRFAPGSRFSYSSAGFACLQRCVERVTGELLEPLMRRLVFDPLGMSSSSYVWQRQFARNHALPHATGRPGEKWHPSVGDASHSLHTTASDFARFLNAVLNGALLTPKAAEAWLTPAVQVPIDGPEGSSSDAAPETHAGVMWGLGWGLESESGIFFQWGANPGFRTLALGSRRAGRAVVVFTNGDAGLRLAAEVAARSFPGMHPAFEWLRLDRERRRP